MLIMNLMYHLLNANNESHVSCIARNAPDHLLLDRSPNIVAPMPRWELDKFKNCWNKSSRTAKILTLFYQQFSNLLIFQRDMSGPRLGAQSNNRWSGGSPEAIWAIKQRPRRDPKFHIILILKIQFSFKAVRCCWRCSRGTGQVEETGNKKVMLSLEVGPTPAPFSGNFSAKESRRRARDRGSTDA